MNNNAKYGQKISKLVSDLKSVKIQGATNVAHAVLEGMRIITSENESLENLEKDVMRVGKILSTSRDNEPLARNAIRFVEQRIKRVEIERIKDAIMQACQEYENMLNSAKDKIRKNGVEALLNQETILTHCHSTTTTNILIELNKKRKREGKSLGIVSTETRPLYQGRKTVKELLKANVSVTQIVDSAAASFLLGNSGTPIGSVIVGSDELLPDGSFINKIGTLSIALAAQNGGVEFYVATTLLKLDSGENLKEFTIEKRPASEVWEQAPEGLKIINPAFDLVPSKYVSNYITEAGALKPKDLFPQAKRLYPWLF